MRSKLCLCALLLAACLAPAAPASARLSDEFTYTYDQLWRATVRMIAVDLRFPISQRDPEIGFVLFEYRDQGRAHHGSVELVRTQGPHGGRQVRVVVQVPSMPSYVERMLLDRLRRKLSSDYGAPPPSRRPPPVADEDGEGDAEGDADEGTREEEASAER
jgi:hypothetical protein